MGQHLGLTCKLRRVQTRVKTVILVSGAVTNTLIINMAEQKQRPPFTSSAKGIFFRFKFITKLFSRFDFSTDSRYGIGSEGIPMGINVKPEAIYWSLLVDLVEILRVMKGIDARVRQ